MRRPPLLGRLTVVVFCGLLMAGCGAQTGDKGEAGTQERGKRSDTAGSQAEASGDGDMGVAPSPASGDPAGAGYDWAEGATETVTESGVTFSVPGDWEEVPEDLRNDREEAVFLWEEGSDRYGEVGVINGGAMYALPREGIDAYLEFIGGDADSPEVEVVDDAVPVGIPGAEDAVRTDYTYPIPGGDGAEAHGYIVGFTVLTGEVVLFVVSGDGVHASEELSEQIISTVSVGAPASGEAG